jgi:hypothetical protein
MARQSWLHPAKSNPKTRPARCPSGDENYDYRYAWVSDPGCVKARIGDHCWSHGMPSERDE